MRKKLLCGLFTTVLALSLIGCAKEESSKEEMPKEFEEMGFTQEEYEELKDIYEDAFGDSTAEDTKEDTKEDVPAKEDEVITDDTISYEIYAPVSDWSNITLNDRAIQIDDTLYVPGVKLGEFMEKVENSSITYEFEYNSGKLMRERDKEKIVVSRNGVEWFTITATNIFKETVALSEIPVIFIDVNEAALPYVRLFNGSSYDDILSKKYTYQDMRDLANSLFGDGYTLESEDSTTRNGEECISMLYSINEKSLPNVTEWSDYVVTAGIGYVFYISKNSNQLIDFNLTTTLGYTWGLSDGGLIESLDQLTDEMIDKMIVATFDDTIDSIYGVHVEFKSLYGMALAQHLMIDTERSVWMILEVEADGQKKYITAEFPRFRLTKKSVNLSGTWYVSSELYDTPEIAIESEDFSHKVIEKTY